MDWMITGGIVAVLFVVWVLLESKRSRSDGTPVKHHPYRQIMWFIMPRRDDGLVFFDRYIQVEKLDAYLEDINKRFECSMSTLLAAVVGRALIQNPRMDRFVVGHRLYQRKQSSISFVMKRTRKDKSSKLATIKQPISADDTIESVCRSVAEKISVERTDVKTYADKEYALFNMLPRPVFRAAYWVFRVLDYYNLLPASFIDNDPLYTSIFMSFMGSVNMDAGYHHLFEHGTCPLFLMIGKNADRVFVEDGQVVVKPCVHVRFTYDERIDDGMTAGDGIFAMAGALEEPYIQLGCVKDDGSDQYKFGDERPRHWKLTSE